MMPLRIGDSERDDDHVKDDYARRRRQDSYQQAVSAFGGTCKPDGHRDDEGDDWYLR